MLVENNGLNRTGLLTGSLKQSNEALKDLSQKFKSDDKYSKNLIDRVDIKNSDSSITISVRTAQQADDLVKNIKEAVQNNREEAILAHSRL